MEMWTAAGPWGVVGAIVSIVVTALLRGWLVPAKTVDTIRAQQQQVTDLWRQTSEITQARADAQQEDLMTLMKELAEALRRSRPAET
jgi:hypothetical protein